MKFKDYIIERSFGPAKGSGDAERAFRPDTTKKCPECGKHFAPSKRFPDMCAKCTRLNKKK